MVIMKLVNRGARVSVINGIPLFLTSEITEFHRFQLFLDLEMCPFYHLLNLGRKRFQHSVFIKTMEFSVSGPQLTVYYMM